MPDAYDSSGNPLQGEDLGLRSLSACILGGLGFGGWGSMSCAAFGAGFFSLIQNAVYYFFTYLRKLIPGFSVTSYWNTMVSDVILLLGLSHDHCYREGTAQHAQAGPYQAVQAR